MFDKKILVANILFFSLNNFMAQEANVSAGGDASGTGGSVSYSFGQIVFSTFGASESISQGVQQPIEISEVLGNVEIEGLKLNLTTFPNPTSNTITIKIEDVEFNNLSFKLFDISGKIIEMNVINSNETNVSLKNLPAATYHLSIIQNNIQLKNFKIIKNQ